MTVAVIWVLVGLFLVLSELVLPSFIAVFFGVGAIVTGICISLGMTSGGPLPWLVFSVVSVGSLLLLRGHFERAFRGRFSGEDTRPGADDDYIGHYAEVVRGLDKAGEHGKVTFRGAQWTARSDEVIADGTQVVIVGRDNLLLEVKPVADADQQAQDSPQDGEQTPPS